MRTNSPEYPIDTTSRHITFLLPLSALIAGLLLLLAAGLKAWQVIHSPVAMPEPLGIPGFTPALIGGEIFLGLWLLSGALPVAARRTAIGCFTLFAGYAFWEALAGKTSCGCFGQVHVNPWFTLLLDAAMVVLLIAFRREQLGGNGTRAASSTMEVGHPARQTLRTMAAKAAHQQNAGHSRWPVGAAVIAGILASITVSLRHPRSVVAGNGLLTADGGKIVILEPHKWLGQRLPVLKHISIGKQLTHGRWVVMFYHADCDVCRHTIPVYEALAMQDAFGGGPRVAFVRVPSDPPGPLPPRNFNIFQKFIDTHISVYIISIYNTPGHLDENFPHFSLAFYRKWIRLPKHRYMAATQIAAATVKKSCA